MPAEQPTGATRLEAYVIQKRLAAALFGDVLLCTHAPTGEQVAVKRVLLSAAAAQRTLASDKKVRENVALERALYRHLQTRNGGAGHANVLRLREEIEFDGYLYLVFDYCERGELYELVSATADGKLPAATARKYLRQIAKGVQFGVRTLIARWGLTKELPAAAIDLLAGMLEADPAQRLTMDAVAAHAFLGLQQPPPPPQPATTTVFRRMASSFPDEVLAKQQLMGDGLDASIAASSGDEPRRPGFLKRAVNRLLRRRSSKRVMALSTRQTTAVSECGPVRAFSASAAAV
ncbi:hypothetical protein PybrP1_003399 [[Pythium] brassicae (nom. inval.)]|nr:hypothetical protein PybrP1_003399 [[Pythium] brassicae (nom. inval.)]